MSEHWFLVDSLGSSEGHGDVHREDDDITMAVELDDAEVRHAAGARRLRDGDRVVLFDGAGRVGRGVLAERGRRVVVESIVRHPAPSPRVEIASAIPKGDRASTMLDMATQLGMTAFVPLRTRHGLAAGRAGNSDDRASMRWARVCAEACKQSHRPWLPVVRGESITPPQAVAEALAVGLQPVLADPSGEAAATALRCGPGCAGWRFLIGPEGGFDDEEVRALRHAGAVPMALGPFVLRIETAVVAAVAAALLVANRTSGFVRSDS